MIHYTQLFSQSFHFSFNLSNIEEEHYKYFKAKIGKLTNDSVEITDTIFIGNNYRKIVSTDAKTIFQKKI